MSFAERIAAGNLAARIDIDSADEIARVAMALNTTAERLEQSFAELESSRQQLEAVLNSMQAPVIAVNREERVEWVNGAMNRLMPNRVRLRAQRELLANVSHELRTPLTSIQGYAETLLDLSTRDHSTREFLDIIRKNASRMSRLTEDLLTLARVESGEQRFRMQEIPASQLIREAQQYFAEMAHLQGSELSIELNEDAMVKADPEAVHQVFSNLISNAVKYCPPGTPITIGARQRDNEVEFFVSDTGPGIASEHLPRLFQRFYRVDKARSRESGGTGLGLAIVKHIVMAHRGTVRVESELHHGSRFFFTLLRAGSEVPRETDGGRSEIPQRIESIDIH